MYYKLRDLVCYITSCFERKGALAHTPASNQPSPIELAAKSFGYDFNAELKVESN